MKAKNLPVKYTGQVMSDELAPNLAIQLGAERQEFVAWLQRNVHARPMRALAIEAASFHFAHQHLQMQLEQRLAEVEELYARELRLLEMGRQHRIKIAVDFKQMGVTLAQLDFQRAKIIEATGKLLQPQAWKEIEREFTAERVQLVRAGLDHRRKRFLLKAVTSDAAERARLRAEFVAKIRADFDDPKAVEEAIDDYDRTLFRFTGEGDES